MTTATDRRRLTAFINGHECFARGRGSDTGQRMHKKTAILIGKILLCLTLLALIAWGVVKAWPLLVSGDLAETIRGFGKWSIAVFLGLQLLQIFVAFLPGEPLEIAAGVLYGAWWGLAVCLLGIGIGTVSIYYGTRLLGAKSIENNKKFDKFRFLKDPKKAYRLVVILFLIPGTPKDVLTYFGPFIPVRPERFFAAAILGRIPSVITSTLAGASLYDGNWKMTIVYFAISAVLALGGILLNKKLEEKWRTRREQKQLALSEGDAVNEKAGETENVFDGQ